MPPWVFDVIILAVIVLSAVMSAGRGLIRETFSIIAFIVGLLVAWLCIRFGQAPLKEMISPDEPSIVPAMILFLAGFLVSYALAAFLGARLSRLFNDSPEIGLFDRLAGAGLGVAKAILACIGFVVLLHLSPLVLVSDQCIQYLHSHLFGRSTPRIYCHWSVLHIKSVVHCNHFQS